MRPGSNVGEDAGGAGVGDEERRTRMVERTARPLRGGGLVMFSNFSSRARYFLPTLVLFAIRLLYVFSSF